MPGALIPNTNTHHQGVPPVQRALIQDNDGNLTLSTDAPIPSLSPQDILIRVHAVGLNPTDWKMPAYFTTPGAVAGCDFAGTVVSVGKNKISHLRVGDRVCGSVHGSNPLDISSGSFADYVRASPDLLVKIPERLGWDEAAALGGVGHGTCALALWECLGLQGTPEKPVTEEIPVLVYGGSTATGTMAIQMLKLSGYSPIAVCSLRNFALAESFGASACFDYASPTCGADIRASTGNVLEYGLDCISDDVSATICYEAIGRAGGQYVCLEMVSDLILTKRKAINSEFLMGYDIYGKEIGLSRGYERPPNPERRVAGVKWFRSLEKLLEAGKIQPHPIMTGGQGIQSVPEGLAKLRSGEVSGKKLVIAF